MIPVYRGPMSLHLFSDRRGPPCSVDYVVSTALFLCLFMNVFLPTLLTKNSVPPEISCFFEGLLDRDFEVVL